MDERMRLVVLVKDGTSISEASRQCGVSRVSKPQSEDNTLTTRNARPL